MPDKIAVLVIDERPIVRVGVRSVLAGIEGLVLVGEVATSQEALRLGQERPPDVILLAPDETGRSSSETIAFLREGLPAARVILWVAHCDDERLPQWVEAGVEGCVYKNEPVETLVGAIRAVAGGRLWFSGGIVISLLQQGIGQPPAVPTTHLTPQERQLLQLVAAGKSDREIGHRLHLAERTVRYHLRATYRKLGARSRVEAAAYAFQLGVVVAPEISELL
ncbi:MAG: response regulator transcription factor [Chloroflexi bacterium]|nr:response regulator transcription factor [Chloroflexota bacterium]MCI0575315.1 response regulator transcription factor [Chloroflexota bacterium]MCI0649780.1 response regulator transcription factor [Chloroflexota bacterium]